MRTQTRKGVFETNSSSTHSIIIASNPNIPELPKKVVFSGGEFGWEPMVYRDTADKASYLYTAIVYLDGTALRVNIDEKVKWIKDLLDKYGVECEFAELVDKEYGENRTYKDFKDGFCYIDHGSELGGEDGFLGYVFESEENMLNYLFSEDSFIITGNDNGDEYDDIYGDVMGKVNYLYTEIYKGN